MSEWQPIETAPLEQDILIYSPKRTFNQGEKCEYVELPFQYVAQKWVDARGEVVFTEAGGDGHWELFPTHWMPLPEPPEDNP